MPVLSAAIAHQYKKQLKAVKVKDGGENNNRIVEGVGFEVNKNKKQRSGTNFQVG